MFRLSRHVVNTLYHSSGMLYEVKRYKGIYINSDALTRHVCWAHCSREPPRASENCSGCKTFIHLSLRCLLYCLSRNIFYLQAEDFFLFFIVLHYIRGRTRSQYGQLCTNIDSLSKRYTINR